MRLLKIAGNGQFSLTRDLHQNIPRYAVLSHTWGDDGDEVTFKDITDGLGQDKAGYSKIQFCARHAAHDNLEYFWVDTCCIDKSSSAEIQEAITQMYRWYRDATKCYVYLQDVWADGHEGVYPSSWESDFRASRWFTRGWTLQELIAPAAVEFYSSNDQLLGDKQSLESQLHDITGIRIEALRGQELSKCSIEERFLWARNRETKREEDKAYCLLGIFDVFMPLLYGEGAERAFRRLEKEIDNYASRTQFSKLVNSVHPKQDGSVHVEKGKLPLEVLSISSVARESGVHPFHQNLQPSSAELYLLQSGISSLNMNNGQFKHGQLAASNSRSSGHPLHAEVRGASKQAMVDTEDWLNLVNFNRRYNMHDQYDKELSRYLDGTCNWIFHKSEYLNWAADGSDSEASQILWICGPAGYGKTVLCAKIIEHFRAKHEYLVAFFFSSLHAASASADDMNFVIRSWLAQIAALDLDILKLIWDSSESSDTGNVASEGELWSLFGTVLAQKPSIVLFLDGFDGYAQTEDARGIFLRKLKSVIVGTATRLPITSREEADIKGELSPESLQVSKRVIYKCKITKDDVNDDLLLYARSVVDQKLPKKDDTLKTKLADQLARRCEGMFLWIKMQQPQLRNSKSKTNLERTVANMPLGLTELYKKNWEGITRQPVDDRERAFEILRWVMFASRPLSIFEISEALAVDNAANCSSLPLEEFDDSIDEEYIDNEIIAICGSLLEVKEPIMESQPGSGTLHVLHPSVRDFLLSVLPKYSNAISDGPSRLEHMARPADHHHHLSTLCLIYLMYDNVWESPASIPSRVSGHAFLDYAARFWHVHLENPVEEDTSTSGILKDFFHSAQSAFRQWAEYFESCQQKNGDKKAAVGTQMYYAALFNLPLMMESIWSEDKTQLNVLGGQYGTPLQAACVKHNYKIFEMLMRWGADPNVQGGRFGTPLIAAAAGGFHDVVTALIGFGADLELKDSGLRTALYIAAKNGFADIVELLSNAGANIDSRNMYDYTPMNAAAVSGYFEVGQLLSERGADILTPTKDGWTPIHVAALDGYFEIVQLLLDRGADVSTPDSDGWTPIHRAAANGHYKVVQLLLDRGADSSTPGQGGWTPIYCAVINGHFEVVQALLDRGVDGSISVSGGWTPIHYAAYNSHYEIVQLLLDRKLPSLL